VSEVTVDGISYWKVDGLTGTGGFSVAELPETGSSINIWYMVGVLLLILTDISRSKQIRNKTDN
jgi:LPXTG-motif cell wall-anchored protein